MLKGALQWSIYPQRTGSIYRRLWQPLQISPLYAGTHFTDPGRMDSWVNFSGKEGHPIIQPSTRPGIELGTSGLGDRNLKHCANSSDYVITTLPQLLRLVITNNKTPGWRAIWKENKRKRIFSSCHQSLLGFWCPDHTREIRVSIRILNNKAEVCTVGNI